MVEQSRVEAQYYLISNQLYFHYSPSLSHIPSSIQMDHTSVLGALLGACKIYKNIELGMQIGKMVIELEPNNNRRYVLLANSYANAGRWEDVGMLLV